jgi:50S ribosomal protein L16 3-hydroxylase
MRTPSYSELLTSYVDYLAQNISDNYRFEEPSFTQQPKLGEFTNQDIIGISQILSNNLDLNNKSLINWFGKYITEYRSLFFEFNQYQEIKELKFETDLKLCPFSKCCYFNKKNNSILFINGLRFKSSHQLAELICNDKFISLQQLQMLKHKDRSIIKELIENGSLI